MTDRAIDERCPQQSDLDGSRCYRESIKHIETSSMDQEAIETNSKKPRWIEIVITAIEKGSSIGSTDSLAIERYWDVVERYQDAVVIA